LQNFAAEISLVKRCDWSIGSVYKHRYQALSPSTMLFTLYIWLSKAYFQCEKCSLLKEKFRNFSFEMEFRNLFPMWKGPKYNWIVALQFVYGKCQSVIDNHCLIHSFGWHLKWLNPKVILLLYYW